jgi:HEAT repeat protein
MQALKVREAIPAMIEIAQNQVGLRSAAVQALTSLDAGTAAPALARLLGDPSLSLRKSLIRLVIESGYAAAAPVLRPLLADPNVEIRRLALDALAALGDQTSLPRIQWMCFHDPNPFVRLAAIDSLVAMLGPGCLPDLISLTGDPNASVRKSAAQHLGGFRPLSPETRAALQRLTQDLFAEVSETARQSLATSLEKGVTDPATPLQPAPPKSPSLLPAAIRPQAADLLRLLRTWQNELPELLRSTSLEEISETDRALARLIGQLENDEKREP